MTTHDAAQVQTETDLREAAAERVARARAAIAAEAARLAEERVRRLAPLQRELGEALAAVGATLPRGAGVARGEARVWTSIARRLGGHEFAASDIVEIAHTIGRTDVVNASAVKKLSRWAVCGRVEKVGEARYRFTSAGRAHYRVGRADALEPVAADRPSPRSTLTVAAAMSGAAAGRRRTASPSRPRSGTGRPT